MCRSEIWLCVFVVFLRFTTLFPDACYDRGATPRFFLQGSLIWELKTSPKKKTDSEKITLLQYRMMKNPMAWVHNENHAKKNKKWPIIYLFSDDFGLRKPRHSEAISDDKCYLYCGIIRRATPSVFLQSWFGCSNEYTQKFRDHPYRGGA